MYEAAPDQAKRGVLIGILQALLPQPGQEGADAAP
jgi:hypothetical protein